MFSYGRQCISEADISAVVKVLKSDFLTQGPKVPEFESAMCDRVGAEFAVAMNSATSALHASCLALGFGPGDLLWTTPNTFVASANCAIYCGGEIDFVDIDANTFNIDLDALEEKLINAKLSNKLPKIIIPVHFGGNPCDLLKLSQLSAEYGFKIIEDASHAVGATYASEPVGSCRYSDITIFSFHPVKVITSGEGGLALTNSQKVAEKLSALRSHGITRDPSKFNEKLGEKWYYEQQSIGFNYRMNDIEAALGLSQLANIDNFIGRRNQIAQTYNNSFDSFPIKPQKTISCGYSSWHIYVVRLLNCTREDRNRVFDKMSEAGIGVNIHYIPVHLQPYYSNRGFKRGDFPAAERYYEQCLTLPIHPQLTDDATTHIINTLKGLL